MIDIGVNLFSSQFDVDRQQVLEAAASAGITQMLLTGTDLASTEQAIAYCEKQAPHGATNQQPACHATAGVHPHHADTWDQATRIRLAQLSSKPSVVAMGEMGLDYFRDFVERKTQRQCFADQAALAATIGLPLFIHDRDAAVDTLAVLRSEVKDLSRVVVHCFTGTKSALENYLDAGCSIGITGWVCDKKRGQALRELIPTIPLDRLLIETDAPYLRPHNAPKANKGSRRNTPALLVYVVDVLAELYGADPQQIAQRSTHNAQQLFNLPDSQL